DVSRIAELVDAHDGRVSFRIDINARWDRLTSLRFLPVLAEAGVELFEQPTPADDLDTLREITQRIGVPVMADESVCSPADALAVVKKQAADVVAIKTTKLGGLLASKKSAPSLRPPVSPATAQLPWKALSAPPLPYASALLPQPSPTAPSSSAPCC